MDIDDSEIDNLPNSELFPLMDVDVEEDPQVELIPTVELPPRFILIKHHPHANKPSEILPLDGSPRLIYCQGFIESLAASRSAVGPI